MPEERRWSDADRELETYAAAVHQAYLDTSARLGWPVKPENQVPYAELSEASKELDRASVVAVLDALTAAGWPRAKPYEQRIAALEELLACYRLGRQPSEALHRRLEQTRTAIARARGDTDG